MTLLDRYIASTLLSAVALVMVALQMLGMLFVFIGEQGNVGVGHYGMLDALQYSAMTLPQFALETFPAGALIGALLGIGVLARSHELTVMRASGMSKLRLSVAVLISAALLVAIDLLIGEFLAQPLGQLVARLGVHVDRVEHRAPQVVLALVIGTVADTHRPRSVIAREVVELVLGELALTADPVHDLQLAVLTLGEVGDEVEEVVGLSVEAERVQRPQHEGRVADPAVAVVPVAFATRDLGKRRGGGCDHRAGRRVAQSLQRQRAALKV